jgi:dTDP-4-dehydrorhamnose reductase
MRILILGGDGMLGHQLLRSFENGQHEVRATLRGPLSSYGQYGIFNSENTISGVTAERFDTVVRTLDEHRPNAVINAIGIIKQRADAHDALISIEINALFPHQLALLCAERGVRLVHMSTDCVFSGRKGRYQEPDVPDPVDLYGRSKLLGELSEAPCITLRTSIIGLELSRKASLIEWYLGQRGTIRGFAKAIYSGFTTLEMARIIERILVQHRDLSGVWHVASAPISKFDLLTRLTRLLQRDDIIVERDESFVCDRSLDGSQFESRSRYVPPAWDAMLAELAEQILSRKTAS